MPLPDVDPGNGPSFTLCVGNTWRPPFVGLLGEMCERGFWEQYAVTAEEAITEADIDDYISSAAKILGRIGFPGNEAGCDDLAPPDGTPDFGVVYSKTYNFASLSTPTGWAFISGVQTPAGVTHQDRNVGSIGWQRRITGVLNFTVPCHFRTSQLFITLVASDLASNENYIHTARLGSVIRAATQMMFPEVSNWTPFLTVVQQYALSDRIDLLLQLDEKSGQSDLLGTALLTSVYVEVSSTAGNPLP